MRIARKLTLLLTMAIAAMAFAASSASAVTVTSEPGGVACTQAPINCPIHIVGESHLDANHVFRIMTCADEFSGFFRANGSGEITSWNRANGDDLTCTREMCKNNNGMGTDEFWPILSGTETGAGAVSFAYTFCLSTAGEAGMSDAQKARCTVNFNTLEEPSNNHHYAFALNQECLGGAVEVEGAWESERAFEIIH